MLKQLDAETGGEKGLRLSSGSRFCGDLAAGMGSGKFQRLAHEVAHALGVVVEIHKPVTVVEIARGAYFSR
jgi:hypothetical protein